MASNRPISLETESKDISPSKSPCCKVNSDSCETIRHYAEKGALSGLVAGGVYFSWMCLKMAVDNPQLGLLVAAGVLLGAGIGTVQAIRGEYRKASFFSSSKKLITLTSDPVNAGNGYVALVELTGEIAVNKPFSFEKSDLQLKKAFADKDAKGVVIRINSGGGSPVQSSLIYQHILELKKEYNKKVIVVGSDIIASGAYYVASVADKIFVDANTIVGSIGVVNAQFGFADLLKKIGVERRIHTAGANKLRSDQFTPEDERDVAKKKEIMTVVHEQFITIVKQGRGKRLKESKDENLFTGDYWIGTKAVQLGLVDGIANLNAAIIQEFGVKAYRDYSKQKGIINNILDGNISFSTDITVNDRNLEFSLRI